MRSPSLSLFHKGRMLLDNSGYSYSGGEKKEQNTDAEYYFLQKCREFLPF